jgi:hypothetical protein
VENSILLQALYQSLLIWRARQHAIASTLLSSTPPSPLPRLVHSKPLVLWLIRNYRSLSLSLCLKRTRRQHFGYRTLNCSAFGASNYLMMLPSSNSQIASSHDDDHELDWSRILDDAPTPDLADPPNIIDHLTPTLDNHHNSSTINTNITNNNQNNANNTSDNKINDSTASTPPAPHSSQSSQHHLLSANLDWTSLSWTYGAAGLSAMIPIELPKSLAQLDIPMGQSQLFHLPTLHTDQQPQSCLQHQPIDAQQSRQQQLQQLQLYVQQKQQQRQQQHHHHQQQQQQQQHQQQQQQQQQEQQ